VRRRRGAAGEAAAGHGFLRGVRLVRDEVPSFDRYPFAIAAVRELEELELDPKVTFFVGENGSGKSTLLEAIAVAVGFNAEGGSKNFSFSQRPSESELHRFLRVARSARRERDGFFLRAEAFFNAATYVEDIGVGGSYGGKPLHEQSHGESFLALAQHRFRGHGLYLLDEPEAALSPARQLSLLRIVHRLVEREASQLIVATHSPILLAYPGARIVHFGDQGIARIDYEETEHYRVTRDFLAAPERYFKHLFEEEAEATEAEEESDE
jgi:predicted ATPase